MPANIARFVRGWNDVGVDLRVVGALAVLAIASTVVFGLLPAIRASRVTLTEALNAGGRSGGSGRHRLRNTMVVVEVALALTLLVAAGLSVRGTANVLWRDDGYDPDGVMTMRVSLLGGRYDSPDEQRAFFEELVADARGALGIEGAAVVNVVPASARYASSSFEVDGRPIADPSQRPSADFRVATPGYFEALRIRLLEGRGFSATDTADTMPVAIVSETMARRYWPGESAIGKRFKVERAERPWHTVVGVAGDVRHGWFPDLIAPTFYVPFAQSPASDMVLVLRTAGDPAPLAHAGRGLVLRRDAGQPVYEVRSLRDVRWEGATGLKFAAAFMGAFGLVGLLLAGVGVYAIMAYAVRQRTHEIGVRIALGASRRAVIGTTLGRGMILTGIGLAIGLAGAYALGAAMERMLFGSIRLDAVTFAVFTAVLALAALAASVVPARRAMRVDPIVALRIQ
jgi:putative ABC transport system permease protein